jgi:hypothetical protein
MKTIKICTILLSILFFTIGYTDSLYNVVKESPASVNLSGYNSIYVGWLDLGANYYGHKENEWIIEKRRNNVDGLQVYLKAALPEKKITGAISAVDKYLGNAELLLLFKLKDKIKYQSGMPPICELLVDVTYLDGKTGRILYTSSLVVTCNAAFFGMPPRNWKKGSFDGRLDNEIFNLANAIAEKIKSGK